VTTRLYPAIRNSFFDNSYDMLSHLDNLFQPIENGSRLKAVKSHTVPKANIFEKEDGYQIELAAPGFSRDEFEITVDNNILSISVHVEDTKENDDHLFSSEWNYNNFKRNWTLPENTNVDNISARYEAGILYVDVPRTDVKVTKRVITIE
jgi:HSP20 family protein